MTIRESSSQKVPYDLRPRKQVERRMMLHTFQLLAEAGFPISTYRYVGFGAFFFVDFILFRRVMGITDMISIEHDTDNRRRVLFNRPFKDIEVLFENSAAYISQINRDKPHILWLDYDGAIEHDHLIDLEIASSTLSAGSILIATFDVDFDKANDIIKETPPHQRADAWMKRFKEESGDHFNPNWKCSDFNASGIYKRTIEVAESAIISGLTMRREINLEPLFNFLYADGHEMLTIGGVISSKHEKRQLRAIEWEELLPFVRRSFSQYPFRIEVPILTRKERLHLDSHMPCDPEWTLEEFELSPEVIDAYNKIHRYCPLYAELLL